MRPRPLVVDRPSPVTRQDGDPAGSRDLHKPRAPAAPFAAPERGAAPSSGAQERSRRVEPGQAQHPRGRQHPPPSA